MGGIPCLPSPVSPLAVFAISFHGTGRRQAGVPRPPDVDRERTCRPKLFRFSWKWRRRSPSKVKERTHEEQRKHYTPDEKVAILRRHLLEQVPISKLCDKQGLQPTVFYRWQKEFCENGAAAFEQEARPKHSAEQERIAYLEKKIQTKDEVLAELMAEHVALKKESWGTLTGVWVPHDTRDQILDFVRR